MHVAEAAAVGVERELAAAGGGVTFTDEAEALALADEPEVLEPIDREVGEGVVDHQVVDVVMRDPGPGERRRAGDTERPRRGEVLHLADRRGLDALARAEHVHRALEVGGTLVGGEDEGPAAVGHQAALQQVERFGDHARLEHVVDRDRVPERGPRIHRRPLALDDGDHRQVLVGGAVGLGVAQPRDREQRRRPHRTVRALELAARAGRRQRTRRHAGAALAALAVGDQHGRGVTRRDRRRGVADVDHE